MSVLSKLPVVVLCCENDTLDGELDASSVPCVRTNGGLQLTHADDLTANAWCSCASPPDIKGGVPLPLIIDSEVLCTDG